VGGFNGRSGIECVGLMGVVVWDVNGCRLGEVGLGDRPEPQVYIMYV
jgi:hypothetical protein